MIPLEPTLSKIPESIQSVSRALRATTRGVVLLQSRSAGRNTARPKADWAKQNIFCGRKGSALPRLIFSKRRDSDFRRAGGCGRNARRIFGEGWLK